MSKVMIFIDGSWLYANAPRLAESYGSPEYQIDFGKLPGVLTSAVAEQMGRKDLDLVRTHLFGSYASNCDPRDHEGVARRLDFFSMLKEEFYYEVELFTVDYQKRRLRRKDRDPSDDFEPKEKCVDIGLATSMLYQAALPYAYDIAIVVIGDRDFVPALRQTRLLAKRVAIASTRGSCALEISDPRDEARVRDYDVIWLDDLLGELELKYEERLLECTSPFHKGKRLVKTTFRPRKGQNFYCDACRAEFVRRQALQKKAATDRNSVSTNGESLTGTVSKKFVDRGFGFIEVDDGTQYYFHLTDLSGDLDFSEIDVGTRVNFTVKDAETEGRAQGAKDVRRHGR